MAILAVALLAAAMLARETRPLAGAPAARAATGCNWTRHAKRVVKRVRRHGRVRRVKRMKHWWTCDPRPAAPADGGSPAAPTPTTPPQEEPPPGIGHLGVKAEEWSYTLSREEVSAGEVAIELNNRGGDPHDLNLRLEGSEEPPLQIPITGSLQRTSKRFSLPAGTYRLWCDLPDHDERGMHATLVVSGDSG